MRKKSDSAKLKLKCDVLWAELVKTSARGLCEYCGKPGSDAHHMVSRSKLFLRHSIANGVYLCKLDHLNFHMREAHTLWKWFEEARPDDYEFVVAHKHTLAKGIKLQEVYARLESLKELL